jgi:hypothetical protein
MKPGLINLLLSFILVFFIFNCTHDTETPGDLTLSIQVLGNPKCKQTKSIAIFEGALAQQSCIEYSFDATAKKLSLKHINVAFNCCPESIYSKVTYRNDSIIIEEIEKHMGCKCNCLYDLDMELNGLEMGKYQLKIKEPYSGNQAQLNFELDLNKQKQGSYCVTRNTNPW